MIREESIPNIKSHFVKREGGGGGSDENNQITINSVMEILKEKLKTNLRKMPSIYVYGETGSQMSALQEARKQLQQ